MSSTPTHIAPSQEKEHLAWSPSDTGRRFLGVHASREAKLLLSLFSQSCPRALCSCRQSFCGFQRRIESCLTFEHVLLNFVNVKTYLLVAQALILRFHESAKLQCFLHRASFTHHFGMRGAIVRLRSAAELQFVLASLVRAADDRFDFLTKLIQRRADSGA